MNRYVYLYELDSVRNSQEEIKRGQRALFEEIVKNGNKVVLSFNQLTDSAAFLCAVKDKKTYDSIVELFTIGAIKISRYKNGSDESIRTPSQYIQKALNRPVGKSENEFLFSGVPVKQTEDLLEEMKDALHYSDISILKERINTIDISNETGKKEYERLDYIIRYIRMILLMSMEELTAVSVKEEKGRSFSEFLIKICMILSKENLWDSKNIYAKEIKKLSSGAISLLDIIRMELKERADYLKIVNNRTEWVNQIYRRKAEDTDVACLAEAIVDLAYNYTVEESINGVSRHYEQDKDDTFEKDLCQRLRMYWKDYREGIHDFLKGDSDRTNDFYGKPLHWKTAVRVLELEKKRKVSEERCSDKNMVQCYETNLKKEQKVWNFRLFMQMLLRFAIALIYIVIFYVVDIMLGKAEELVTIIGSTIIFGLIGSVVAEFFRLPDILESVKNIWFGLCDSVRLILFRRGSAYQIEIRTGERYD